MSAALEILTRERDALAGQLRDLRAQIRDLDSAIRVLSEAPSNNDGPVAYASANSLAARVMTVLDSVRPCGIAAKEIVGILASNGRPTSFASVTSTLSRLKSAGHARNEQGVWFPVAKGASEAATSEAPMSSALIPEEDSDPLLEPDAENEAVTGRRTPFVSASDTRF